MKSTKRRIAIVLIALVCLFVVLSNGEREAWDCPECGRKGNTGNYCGYCKHPAPGAAPAYGSDSTSGYGYTTHMIMLNEEAGKHSRSIRQLKRHAICRINGMREADGVNWYEVVYNGEKGYINGYYFKQLTRAEMEQLLPEYLEGLKGNTETPAQPLQKTYSAGDMITFGHYEQDNNLNNGQEAIEWIVLDYDAAENKALLLSRYGLDAKQYHGSNVRITWEKCSLRSWLNGEFLKTAFTAEEQKKILKTNVDNSRSQGYSEWNVYGGFNTVDQIFLLSDQEAFEKYFKDKESRTCKPTAYAIAQGANGWWWLRSPGSNQRNATYVSNDGSRYCGSVLSRYGCVRPALWLNLETLHSAQKTTGAAIETEQVYGPDSMSGYGYTTHMIMLNEEASKHSRGIWSLKRFALCRVNDIKEADGIIWYEVIYNGEKGYINGHYFKQMTRMELEQFLESPEYLEGLRGNTETPTPIPKKTYSAGDIITFGHYEQDNNLNNGQEAIEWIVLDYDAAENEVLLLSRYGLDAKPYHESYKGITWEKCSLRSWLNGDFLKTAFTADEQRGILKTNVNNSKSQGYSGWNTDGGNDTVDQVFLLSYREAFEEYFKDYQSRFCKPTAYAKAQGAYAGSSTGSGWWWLRSPGGNQGSAADVSRVGTRFSSDVDLASGCIRPALWVNLDSGIL